MTDNWVDISVPLRTAMVSWPGDPEPILERIAEIERGDMVNVTFLRLTAHTGTHMDAPCHFLAGREGIETFPLEVGIGPARVLQVPRSFSSIPPEFLEDKNIQKGDRILFRTKNSEDRWDLKEFQRDFTGLSASAAQYLVDRGVQLVGIDYLSIGVFDGDGSETHHILLGAKVWILEGLKLGGIEEGSYELICLPLPINGSDGSPARAILKPIQV
jgi:arylformamidase